MRRKVTKKVDSKPKVVPKDKPKSDPLLRELAKVILDNEANTSKVLAIQEELIGLLDKPKEKKNWKCTVGRDSAGSIKNIDIQEK